MGKSELREELIRFCDSIRNYEHESGHSIYQDERESSEFVDIFLTDSHSPTEPDALVEGDWFYGTATDYGNVLSLENHPMFENSGHVWVKDMLIAGCCVFDGDMLTNDRGRKKTQLTAPEFIRRAGNTFKK